MAKMTAEARKHLITKNSVSYRATLRTFDMKTGAQGTQSFSASGDFATEQDMLGFIASRNTTSELAVVPVAVNPVEKIEDRRALFDDEFFRIGHILKEDEKLAGLMVRTLNLNTVHCISADFETQTFSKELVQMIGNFDTAEECVTWYKKRTPTDKKIYGKFVSMESTEIKVAVPVSEFFAHSFSISNEE